MTPANARNVMASRREAPDSLDFFPTPPWAARAGGELIKRLDPAARKCWEPACGEGHMAHGLKDYFEVVGSSDIHPYGYGSVFDFLSERDPMPEGWTARPHWDWVVTNPPFKAGEAFVRMALSLARRGVAMLCRTNFIESASRYPLLFGPEPMAVFAPFIERVPMQKGSWDPDGSTATAYAWFVWLKPAADFRDASHPWPQVMPIPPGTKARLHKTADVVRFCKPATAGGLFDG